MNLSEITEAIRNDPRNADYTKRGIPPILQISPEARVLIIGQAPGRRVEESGVPFDDKSGETLRDWMGVDRDTFYSGRIAVLPMDFYYPGKGKPEICRRDRSSRASITPPSFSRCRTSDSPFWSDATRSASI